MGIKEFLRRIWLISANKIKLKPLNLFVNNQLKLELNSSLRQTQMSYLVISEIEKEKNDQHYSLTRHNMRFLSNIGIPKMESSKLIFP